VSQKGRHLRAVLPPDDGPTSRAPVGRRMLRRTLARERERRGSLLGWLMLMGLAAIAAAIVGPHLVDIELPTEAGFIGTPARARVIADRDYDVVDEAVTTERRGAARLAVIARFDHDTRRAHAVIDTCVDALSSLATEGANDGDRAAALDLLVESLELKPTESATVVDELSRAGTDATRLAALRERLHVANERMIVDERAVIDREGARGMSVTSLGTPVTVQNHVDTSLVVTVDDARTAERALLVENAWSAQTANALARLVMANLTFNASETERLRARAERDAPPVVVRVRRGESVLVPGQLIGDEHLPILVAMSENQGERKRARAMIATFAFVLLVSFVVYRFGFGRVLGQRARIRDLSFLSLLVLSLLFALVGVDALLLPLHERFPEIPRTALVFAIPATWAAMQARLVLHAEGAFAVALLTALFAGAVTEPGLGMTIVSLLASLVGIAGVGRLRSRTALLFAGLAAGVTGALTAVTWELFRGSLEGQALLWVAGALVVNGALSGLLVIGLSPVLEGVFGYVSDLKLLSLDDMNSPLLKELIVRAPGTWHHSMRVALLAEGAADAVGANALLARVIGLFHDVGKLASPEDFIENIRGTSAVPASTDAVTRAERIRAHVDRGRVLAVEHRLPRAVIVGIEEHHADVVILDRSRADAPLDDDESGAHALHTSGHSSGGRRPRSRESALVMLADRVEWATRDVSEMGALTAVIDATVADVLIAGSLGDSELSVRELEQAKESFARLLLEMSPARPDDTRPTREDIE
jgi:putative nucleotidyltransferase with HDIG domain